MGIKDLKSPARLLDKDWVNKIDLDLSKEVLWVSVGQKVTVLWAVKVRGKKKFYQSPRFEPALPVPGRSAEFFSNL